MVSCSKDATEEMLGGESNGEAIYYRALSSESEGNEGFGANARVRPVVTVTINKEP